MTMLCWLYPGGQDGPIFNYRTSGSWGVHLWVVAGQLFVRFTKRDYSFTNALIHTALKPKDGWKFVGASYDHTSGDAKLWVDGIVVQTLTLFRPGFFLLPWTGGGLRRPYPCNAATANCMTPQFTPNDVVIISSI